MCVKNDKKNAKRLNQEEGYQSSDEMGESQTEKQENYVERN